MAWRWRDLVGVFLCGGLLLGLPACRPPATENRQVVGGVAAHLAVVPEAMVESEPGAHARQQQPSSGRFNYYVVVTLFDAQSGSRIERAIVDAKLTPHGMIPTALRLQPVNYGSENNFGASFLFFTRGRYSIDLQITVQGRPDRVLIQFVYDHCRPGAVFRGRQGRC